MSDINKIIQYQKRELEAKLALISGNNLSALMTERKGYEAKISEIDAKIHHICKELGIEVGLEAPAKKERRPRMSGADTAAMTRVILDACASCNASASVATEVVGLNVVYHYCTQEFSATPPYPNQIPSGLGLHLASSNRTFNN